MNLKALLIFTFCFISFTPVFSQCPPGAGSVFIKSQEQLEDFLAAYPDCTELDYDINLSLNREDAGTPINSLLPLLQLKKLNGGLIIRRETGNTSLPSLQNLEGLNNLEVLERLLIFQDTEMTSLKGLDKLTQLHTLSVQKAQKLTEVGFSNAVSILNVLILEELPELIDITKLSVNNSLHNLSIYQNPKLIIGAVFNNLTIINAKLRLNHPDISFVSKLRSTGSLELHGNGPVQDLSDFSSLTKIKSSLELYSLYELTDLDFFENVETEGAMSFFRMVDLPQLNSLSGFPKPDWITSITLASCPLLADLSLFDELEFITTLIISDMASLENLDGFQALETVESNLTIHNNPNMVNLEGLNNLREVQFSFYISENPKLQNLDALEAVTHLAVDPSTRSKLYIHDNPSLESILGLRNAFGTIYDLKLYNNPRLEICHIQPVCQNLFEGVKREIHDNGLGCEPPETIIDKCYDPIVQKIFFDQNESGLDEGEYGVPIGESIYNGTYTLYPDNEGIIRFSPLDGEINLSYKPEENWAPSTDIEFIEPSSNDLDTLRSGIYPLVNDNSMVAYLAFDQIVCDRPYRLKAILRNTGTTILNVNTTVTAAGTYSWSSPDPVNIDGSQVSHEVHTLLPGQVKEISFIYIAPNVSDIPLGAGLNQHISYEVYDEDFDFLFSDEKDYEQTFLCAYDPNDKSVFPAGVEDENLTLFDEELQYHIRFQNTGNYFAEDVVIRDTLDRDLDLASFQFIGSSHPISEIVMERNVLAFVFENIFLPDSISNEPASHGYVSYIIKPKQGLEEFTKIENTAHIYFDNNPAIVTNTTKNTLVSQLSSLEDQIIPNVKAQLSPNPFVDRLTVKVDDQLIGQPWKLLQQDGKVITTGLVAESEFDLSITPAEPGLYLLNIGAYSFKLLKLE